MPNMNLLKKKITESGIPITVICERSGIERATMYNRLDGKGEWKASEIVGISSALKLSIEDREEIFLS